MKKPTRPTLKEMATATGFCVSTLQRYAAQGCDVFDSAAVKKHALGKQNPPRRADTPEMAATRQKLLEVQIERHEHFLKVARGEVVPVEEVRRDMIRVAMAVRTALQRLEADAPSWAGLSANVMDANVRSCIDRICADLHDATSSIYQSGR